MSERSPIIITGADRSGTTLLYSILASHSDVSMVRRTNLWRWFYGSCGDLADEDNLEHCLELLMRYPRIAVLKPDLDEIRSAFRERPPLYGELFSIMHEQEAARRGRRRWGNKSLHNEHHAAEIFRELPDVRMIQLVRDPRDRYSSISRRYDDTRVGVGSAMGRWVASVRAGRANMERYGTDRYQVVRYETLARDPEATVRELCEFLQLPYESEMLEMRGVSDAADDSGNSSFEAIAPGQISTRSIGRFRQVLSPSTVGRIQVLGGRLMDQHDYGKDNVSLTGKEAVRFWMFEVPVTAVRSLAVRAQRAGSRRRRRPPQHRLVTAEASTEQ